MKKRNQKTYRVRIGTVNADGIDYVRDYSWTVLAHDVAEAVVKVAKKIEKDEYIASCEMLNRIDY